jgi:serine/threonine protein kinase
MIVKMLGKYELQGKLGEGGFGTVYRAMDTTLGVERALKVLHPQLSASAGFVERFLREARLGARLEHDGIVPVYEVGEVDGSYYLVMRFMAGGSLKDVLSAQGQLTWDRALAIVRQVAGGLDYAHAAGVIHRDVKPGNILFDETGAARLGDFGYARAVAGDTSLTASGMQVGTPHYMAPELWLGARKAGPPTGAVDNYALACVFYEILTGEILFDGETPPEVMTQHITGDFSFPVSWPVGTPIGIEAVLRQALAKEPGKRFATCGEFVSALESLEHQISPKMEKDPAVQSLVEMARELEQADNHKGALDTYRRALRQCRKGSDLESEIRAKVAWLKQNEEPLPPEPATEAALAMQVEPVVDQLVYTDGASSIRDSAETLQKPLAAVPHKSGAAQIDEPEIALGWIHVLWIALGWSLGLWIGAGLYLYRVMIPTFYPYSNMNISVFIGLSIGGFITGLVLRTGNAIKSWRSVLLITLGWVIGLPVGLWAMRL